MDNNKTQKIDGYKKTTWLVHGPGKSGKWDFSHNVVPPMSCTTAYRVESLKRGARGFSEYGTPMSDKGDAPIYIYERMDEPIRSLLESDLAKMEGGEMAATFSSGMAAISAGMGFLMKQGKEVIAHHTVYGCTHSLFTLWYPKMGFKVKRADFSDLKAVKKAISKDTRILYFESPVNPTLELIDIGELKKIADAANAKRKPEDKVMIVIDNTFATPFCQRPIEHGADIVIHSLTKNLSGFGTEIGGAVICPKSMYTDLMMYRKDFGGVLNSKSAWTIKAYGLPTLPVRLRRQQHSAMKIATWLENCDWTKEVRYPGLRSFKWRKIAEKQMINFDGEFSPGQMIYFKVDESRLDPAEFVDEIARTSYAITLAVSLGHVKTLIEVPSCMTHSAYGDEGDKKESHGIRLSIGLESPSDIMRDMENAMKAMIKKPTGRKTARR
ncbi:trans-sulfuration enzyme family protein [Elusimicrobiota bacterium]